MEWIVLLLAVTYLLLSIDSLWIDWLVWRKKIRPTYVTETDLKKIEKEPEKKILIFVPAWREAKIIQRMLRGNLENIHYQNYQFIVGCYPNDMATCRSIWEIAKDSKKVSCVLNERPGPTSKGQMLNLMVQEALNGVFGSFDIILFQDSEDIIHPESLKLINTSAKQHSFIQLPVFSFLISQRFTAGAVYMEEFAEAHSRDLLVRNYVRAAIPSAGVGTAITRMALHRIQNAQKGKCFDEKCLTEDYQLGVRAHELGISQYFLCCFKKDKLGNKDWIATREYFPKSYVRSVKQKARWIQGITLESFKDLGWFGSKSNRLFLWRDRKALLANCLGMVGLGNLVYLPFCEGFSLNLEVQSLLFLNGLCFVWRFLFRHQAFSQVYQRRNYLALLLRYPLSILVNGGAGFLALKNYSVSQFKKQPSPWVKTDHEIPADFGQIPATLQRSL